MHIGYFAPPMPGHVYPTLGIAAELTRRGHRVSYVISERLKEAVAETGACPVVHEPLPKPGAGLSMQITGSAMVPFLNYQMDQLKSSYPVLSEVFAGDEPDLVVHDSAYLGLIGPVLAARWGVPSVQTYPSFASNKHWSLAKEYLPGQGRMSPAYPRAIGLGIRLTKLLRSLGVRVDLGDFLKGTGARARLALFPRAFQFAGQTFDESFSFVGPCFSERAFQGSGEQPADPDRRLVIVTTYSGYSGQRDWPEFFPACVAAFADLPWRFVIVVGQNDPGELGLGTVPENIEFHQRIPLLRVLPRADLHICSAGMGSAMESLYYGVPVLAIPHHADQPAVADRIAELGLGRKLRVDETDARSLREAAVGILGDEQVRGNVREMQSLVRDAGGPAAAADIIEQAATPAA
jgi:MGT family glycosyltransferase